MWHAWGTEDRHTGFRLGRTWGKKIPLGRQSKGKFVPVNGTKTHRESEATAVLTSASDRHT
jgi:hypothetical protein